jgi:ribosomal-protein-alanine N-acetyltransferase
LKSVQNLKNNLFELKPMTIEHIDGEYLTWLNDPDINKYLSVRFFQPYTVNMAVDFFNKSQNDKNFYFWAVFNVIENELVGTITLRKDPILKSGVIGIMLNTKSKNSKGASYEVVNLVLQFGFNVLELNRITAGCVTEHYASSLHLKKTGFKLEGLRRKSEPVSSTSCDYYDTFIYAILREDWEKLSREGKDG